MILLHFCTADPEQSLLEKEINLPKYYKILCLLFVLHIDSLWFMYPFELLVTWL